MNPQRCLTNLVGGMGECLACEAAQGEACRPGAATGIGQDMYLVGPQLGVAPHRTSPARGYVAGYEDARADALRELRYAVRDIKEGDEPFERLAALEADILTKALPEKAGKP